MDLVSSAFGFNFLNPMGDHFVQQIILNADFWPGKYGIYVYGFRVPRDDLLAWKFVPYRPLKWNGSAIETLFSQFKSISGGKLDCTNCATD